LLARSSPWRVEVDDCKGGGRDGGDVGGEFVVGSDFYNLRGRHAVRGFFYFMFILNVESVHDSAVVGGERVEIVREAEEDVEGYRLGREMNGEQWTGREGLQGL